MARAYELAMATLSIFSIIRRRAHRYFGSFGLYSVTTMSAKTALPSSDGAHKPKLFRWQLTYRPPFDWAGMLRFLGARMLKGVEWVRGDEYLRTARLGHRSGWFQVHNAPGERALVIELSRSLAPAVPALLARIRHLFDLGARPNVIAERLMRGVLADTVARNPGLRVPGAFDGFELPCAPFSASRSP